MKTITCHFAILLFTALSATAQFDIELELFAPAGDVMQRPTVITNAGDERLFVVSQNGRIYILNPSGEYQEEPFLDISAIVQSSGNEQGLLGLAFDPDYSANKRFYVNYTHATSDGTVTRISRFLSSDDPDVADAASETVLLEFDQPFSNHNGGHISFGPDGYLYIGTGDGGSFGDPQNNGQSLSTFLGKLLRIDVSGSSYAIPSDNPFIGVPGAVEEIWAYGLRNPWKFYLDAVSQSIYIADVGQGDWEEINVHSLASGGANFGWRCYEALEPYDLSECSGDEELTWPVYQYEHSATGGCSVTGGVVYHGSEFPGLQGKYMFCDYCSGDFYLMYTPPTGELVVHHSSTSVGFGIAAFGSNTAGDVFLANNSSGDIFKLRDNCPQYEVELTQYGDSLVVVPDNGDEYVWYENNVAQPPSENPYFTGLMENSTYYVEIFFGDSCSLWSGILDTTTGINDRKADMETLQIFPNPADEVLKIQLPQSFSLPVTVEIKDLAGKTVQTRKTTAAGVITVKTVNLETGLYFISVASDGKKMSGRFVKQ